MTLYIIAGFTIALAVVGLAVSMRETKTERAQTYPEGSRERRSLEGRQ